MKLPWILIFMLMFRQVKGQRESFHPSNHSELHNVGALTLNFVLESSPKSHCSIFFITDGDTEALQTYTKHLYRHAPFGIGVFEMAESNLQHNMTEGQFSSVIVNQIRKLRQLSWCVNIVVVSDDTSFLTSFAEKSLRGRLLVWATRLLVATRLPLREMRHLLASSWSFSMMNSIAIVAEESPMGSRCGVYAYLPYSQTGGEVVRLASWTRSQGFITLTDLPYFYDKFSNFHGAVMNVTAGNYKPYWFEMEEELPDGSVVKKLNGMDFLLLDTVAGALNFTTRVLPIKSWAQALDRVVSKEAFITPVIHAVLRQRLERFDYTIPYTYAAYSLSMKAPGLTPKWQSLYYPLADTVWVSILAVTVLVIGIMYVVNKVSDFNSRLRSVELTTVILEVAGSFFGQNLKRTFHTTTPSRVVVCTWLIFAFIVGTAYRGNLTAALTLPKYPPRPETLREVVQTVHKVTIEPWGKDYKAYFAASDSDVFIKLADIMELGPALLDGLHEATEQQTAHMDSRAVLELNIAESFTGKDGTSSLYVVRESAIPGMAAWPIPHDSPFKKNLDRCIRASLEAGLYDKWEKDMLELARKESRERQRRIQKEGEDGMKQSESSESNIMPLTIVHMQGPLILLFLGLVLGTLLFLVEMITAAEA